MIKKTISFIHRCLFLIQLFYWYLFKRDKLKIEITTNKKRNRQVIFERIDDEDYWRNKK